MRALLRFQAFIASLLLAALVSEPAFAESEQDFFALVTKVEGEGAPRLRRRKGTETVAAKDVKVYPGDRITTDGKSIVELAMQDGSIVRIGLNSEYRLTSVKEGPGLLAWVFQLTRGSIRAMIEKSPEKKHVKFRVNTPVGTMGVRGTELVLNHRPESEVTTLFVIEGEVEFGRLSCPKEKSCFPVTTGNRSSVGRSGPATPPEAFQPLDLIGLRAAGESQAANKNGSGSATPGAAADAGAVAGSDQPLGGLALFEDLKKISGRSSSVAAGDVNEMIKRASEEMAAIQDALIDRDKATREAMHAAMKDGTFAKHIALSDKFNELAGGKKKTASQLAKENRSGGMLAKKFKFAKSVAKAMKRLSKEEIEKALSSGRMSKNTKSQSSLAFEAMKKSSQGPSGPDLVSADGIEKMLKDAESEIAGALALLDGSKPADPVEERTPPKSEPASSRYSGYSGMPLEEKVQEEKVYLTTLLQDLLEDKTFAAEWESIKMESEFYYQCQMPYRWYGKTYCSEKKGEGIYDGDHDQATLGADGKWYNTKLKTKHIYEEGTYSQVKRTAGKCTKTVKSCKKGMIPCDLSSGKFCKPEYKEICGPETTVEVACPQ